MKRLLMIGLVAVGLALVIGLTGCSSVGEVIPIGLDTYTVSSSMGGQFPAWSEVKALSLTRANEFCDSRHQYMTVIKWDTHGARGWTPLNAELTFTCTSRVKETP